MTVTTNSDRKYVKEIRKKLKENDGYCPCKILKIDNNKCMCKEFRDMIERKESGECHCGLYILNSEE